MSLEDELGWENELAHIEESDRQFEQQIRVSELVEIGVNRALSSLTQISTNTDPKIQASYHRYVPGTIRLIVAKILKDLPPDSKQ